MLRPLPPLLPSRRYQAHGHTLITLLLALALIAGGTSFWWHHYHQQQRVIATIGSYTLTQHELSIALRASLWRQNLTWQNLTPDQQQAQRERVFEETLNTHLLEAALPLHEIPQGTVERDAEQRLQQSLKQFESPAAWQARAASQHLDETTMRTLLRRETRLSHAIEKWLAQQAPSATEAETETETEAQAEAWFTQHQGQFQIPESAHASHLFLTVHDKEKPNRESDIRAYHQRITTGQATLAALATQFSDDPRTQKTGGDLGWFSRTRVPTDFADSVFALSPGQISQPFLTRLGWHIVQLHEKRPARPATFAESKAEILAHLQDQRRRDVLQKLLQTQRASTVIETHPERLRLLSPAS